MTNNKDKNTTLWISVLDKKNVEGKNKARKITDAIIDVINGGGFPEDTKIITQALLISILKVSKTTAQRVSNNLKNEGHILTDGRRGSAPRLKGSVFKEESLVESHGRELYFNYNAIRSSEAFYKRINSLIAALELRFENLNPDAKAVNFNLALKQKLQEMLNQELSAEFKENEVYYNVGRKNTVYNIFTSFLKSEEVFVLSNPSTSWIKEALNNSDHEKRTVLIGYDEFGPSAKDLELACIQFKVGIVYLNSRSSFFNNRVMSKKRAEEILALQNQYGFLIIEDDLYAGMFKNTKNIFMKLSQKYNSNTIYMRRLTIGYYKSDRLIAIAGNEENIALLKKNIIKSGKAMNAALCAIALELLENGDLIRNEKNNYLKVLKVNKITREVLNSSELLITEGISNREGILFHISLAGGKLPDNIYELLVKRGIYTFDPNHYHWIEGTKKGIMISIGWYVEDLRLKQDLEHLLQCIEEIIQ